MAVARNRVGVHVVEDHDEALVHIYRLIGAKKLSFNNICLVHFDSHPDLLIPDVMADDTTNKDILFSQTSIADWITPAVYAGHISCIIWLKPVWSQQIEEGCYRLVVGKDSANGKLRVATPLSYFISELLYSPEEHLENCREAVLHVLTVPLSTDSAYCSSHSLSGSTNIATQLHSLLSLSSSWILDFDLDFFSTGNPFKHFFSEKQFQFLKELYKFELSFNSAHSLKSVMECVQQRETQLKSLEAAWSKSTVAELTNEISDLRELVGSEIDGKTLEPSDLHLYGMMTDLPVHISTGPEINRLMESVQEMLSKITTPMENESRSLSPPTLVTVARSSEDEYTPPSQVDDIQAQLLATLNNVYLSNCEVFLHYEQQ